MNKLLNKIWDFIKSIRLGIALFILLIAAAMLGTLLPQQEQAAAFFERLNPLMQKVYVRLTLYDLYHAPWFRLIIALLALNLLACSLDRLPKTLKLLRARPKTERSGMSAELPADRSLTFACSRDEAQKAVLASLAKQFRKVDRREKENEFLAHAEKGRWSYFSVYAVHLSVILILLGALVGSVLGFEGLVTLEPGAVARTLMLRKANLPLPLGFSVRCDKFEIDFYEDGTPRQYRSEISFIQENKVVRQRTLEVNRPAAFQGITFYQSGFGAYLGDTVSLRISGPGVSGEEKTEAALNQVVPLPGGEFEILEINEDFFQMGPAVRIALRPAGKPAMEFWVFQDLETVERVRAGHPGMLDALFGPAEAKAYRFIVEKKYYTELQANRDPGIPLVWSGFLLLVLGLSATFFFSHRQVWVRLAGEDGRVVLGFAIKSNKNRIGAENELARLVRRVRGTCERESV